MIIQCLIHLIGSLAIGGITSDPEGWGGAWVKKWGLGQAPYSPPALTLTLPISLCSLFQFFSMALEFISGMRCPQEAIGLRKLPLWLLALFQDWKNPLSQCYSVLSLCPNTPLLLSCTHRQEATGDHLPQSREPTAGEGEQASLI